MPVKWRFLISLLLSLPMLAEMVLNPLLGWVLPGGHWTMFWLTTGVMLVAAGPFMQSAWAAFKNHQANMDTLIAIGTSAAYGYSLYALWQHQPVFFEVAAVVIAFVLLGQVLEETMKGRASSAIEKLMGLQAKEAEVDRGGQFVSIPSAEVAVGDVVRVKPGQRIAVDGVIIEGQSVVDEALVTGESLPVAKGVGDVVIGSTINGTGAFLFKATKVGSDTLLAQIVEMVRKAQVSRAPIQRLVDTISGVFVPVVLMVAIVTFVVWYVWLDSSVATALLYAVAVLIIACPCALGLATPTALMVGIGRGSRLGILIKNGEVLEAANGIKTVVFDKTGTITVGKPVVTDIVGDQRTVLAVAAALEQTSEHPLAGAILAKAEEGKVVAKKATNFKAVEGRGVTATVDGRRAFVGSLALIGQAGLDKEMTLAMERLQQQAKTVVVVGLGSEVLGLIAIQDEPKVTAAEAVAALKKRDLRTVMMTGDNRLVAEVIAEQVGIDEVVAEVLPGDKAEQVAVLQQAGEVAFVGDGINDAPALAVADVGIAMGSGTDIAIESGGIVVVKNSLQDVVTALSLSQKTLGRIRLNLFWAFIYNAAGIPIAAGLFAGWGLTLSPELAGLAMAFSSVSVLTSSLLLNKSRL